MNNSTMRLRINNGIQIGLGLVVVAVCVASVRFFLTDTEVTEVKSVEEFILSQVSDPTKTYHKCFVIFLNNENIAQNEISTLKITNDSIIINISNIATCFVYFTDITILDNKQDLKARYMDKDYYITFDETRANELKTSLSQTDDGLKPDFDDVTDIKPVPEKGIFSTISESPNEFHECFVIFLENKIAVKKNGKLKISEYSMTFSYGITMLNAKRNQINLTDDKLDLIVNVGKKKYYLTFDETRANKYQALLQSNGGRRKSKRKSRSIRAR